MADKQPNPYRKERSEGILQELAAQFLQTESSGKSLMTITRTALSSDGTHATFFLSILPVSEETRALEFAKRKRSELREYIEKKSKIGRIPLVDFEIDFGEKKRQRVDELLAEGENQGQ